MSDNVQIRAYRFFRSLLERPETDREALIAATAKDEPEVAASVRRMLRDFEDVAEGEIGEAIILPEWARDREGTLVNGWRIEQHLAMGGFGRVYRALRPAPGGMEEAAIKFLDMAPDQVPRFLQERQMLADLDHEGICKFIDGGTTGGGVPFMVMEYVAGLPITRYCDYHRQTITDRLKLFVKLCHAVEYAHEYGVLHRDLKPANILVTAAGAVRVLDFGVAKLLDPSRVKDQHLTKAGETPWTRVYASPEQVVGKPCSLATDVYALGVLLYELVSGELPFSEFALSGQDWMRVISEREPLPPSQALLLSETPAGSMAASHPPETAAELRGASQSRLKRVLAGNLDAVILKALRKDPRQRYPRVDRLRLDVELFLEGMPVSARHSSAWERTWNWSAKHRFAAGVGAVWTLWMVTLLQVGMLQDIRYGDDLRAQEDAVRRLRYLAQSGLSAIEEALPSDPDASELRLLTAQIHTRLLQSMEAMPPYSLAKMDSSTALSALQCGRFWKALGNPEAALAATTSVLLRMSRRYDLDRGDRQWRDLYTGLLRQRIELCTILRQNTEAAEDARRLAEIEERWH